MTIHDEIEAAAKALHGFGRAIDAEVKAVCGIGGAYFAAAAEAAAPVGKSLHKRYSTYKVSKAIRAPKGMGNVVATYTPGNLARSMRVLDLKKTRNAVYVGARLQKGAATGTFSGMRTDGYYLHMVEGGTKNWPEGRPFFHQTWNRVRPRVVSIMAAQFERIAKKWESQNAIPDNQLSLF
jgi:HK97 gp10 family phage protein